MHDAPGIQTGEHGEIIPETAQYEVDTSDMNVITRRELIKPGSREASLRWLGRAPEDLPRNVSLLLCSRRM